MSRFTELRGLVTRANALVAEGRKLSSPGARAARYIEADECRAKAEWLAGRLTDDEYNARLVECLDARIFSTE